MIRRNFLQAVATTLTGLFCVNKSFSMVQTKSNNKKWWTERKSTFDGYPITYYDWPRDRLICLTYKRTPDNFGGKYIHRLMIPSFPLDALENSNLDFQIRESLYLVTKDIYSLDSYNKSPHIHVFKIDGLEDEYGIAVTDGPAEVTTDFFEEAEYAKNRTIKRRNLELKYAHSKKTAPELQILERGIR